MVKHGMVSYLNNREIGNDSHTKKLSPGQHDAASVIAEQKATAPTKNMVNMSWFGILRLCVVSLAVRFFPYFSRGDMIKENMCGSKQCNMW